MDDDTVEADEAGQAPKDPLRQLIKESLESVSRDIGGISELVHYRAVPSSLESLVVQWFDGSLEAFIDSVWRLSEKVDKKARRLALKAALGMVGSPEDLDEAYAKATTHWRGTGLKQRVNIFRAHWEEVIPVASRYPGFSRLSEDDKFDKTRNWWYDGRDKLVELLARELESRDLSREATTLQPGLAGSITQELEESEEAVQIRIDDAKWRRLGGFRLARSAALSVILPIFLWATPCPMVEPLATIYIWASYPTAIVFLTTTMLLGCATLVVVKLSPEHSLALRIWKWVVNAWMLAIVASMGLLVFVVPVVSSRETTRAAYLESSSYVKFSDPFDSDRECQAAGNPKLGPILPFSHCIVSGGALHVRMLPNQSHETMGVGSVGNTVLDTVREGKPLRYYIATKFKNDRYTPLGSCGLSIEGNTGVISEPENARSIFLHIRDSASIFQHIRYGNSLPNTAGEIAATNINPDPAVRDPYSFDTIAQNQANFHPVSVLATSSSNLPFLLRPTLFEPKYDQWTKLAALVEGDQITFFIDDRAVATTRYQGLRVINRIGVAMLAPRQTEVDYVACDFDYLEVRQLPATALYNG